MVCETPLPFGEDVAEKLLGNISTIYMYFDRCVYMVLYIPICTYVSRLCGGLLLDPL